MTGGWGRGGGMTGGHQQRRTPSQPSQGRAAPDRRVMPPTAPWLLGAGRCADGVAGAGLAGLGGGKGFFQLCFHLLQFDLGLGALALAFVGDLRGFR